MNRSSFSPELLKLDCAAEAERIGAWQKEAVLRRFKKKGVVVALSGGIDSSVVGGLSVGALGRERVLGLLMPERDSAPETLQLSRNVAEHLGIEVIHEDITPILEAVGCYDRRDEAIRRVVPDFDARWKSKIVLPSVVDDDKYRFFSVVVRYPDGRSSETRLDLPAYLGIVAATNFKQRVSQDAGVLPRRPPELRRGGNAQPPRVRPGLLREAR